MTVLNEEETKALAEAAFVTACAQDERLKRIRDVAPEFVEQVWIHGFLTGRRDSLSESAELWLGRQS